MCSINGINFKNEKIIFDITKSNQFRGPDKTNILSYENYYFGFNLLSINSNRETEIQPKISERYIFLFNGEIYNTKKLIDEFKIKGNFNSDTDVLFELIKILGTEFIEYIDGMYSIVLFDKYEKKYFLFRDRFGTKPLFYYFDGSKFYFSSSLTSLSKNILSINLEINKESLNKYINFGYNFGEKTLLNKINQVENGQIIIFDDKRKILKSKKFISKPTSIKNYENFRSTIRNSFESKHNVALLLSGGIDSNILLKENIIFSKERTTAFSTKFLDVEDKYNEDFFIAKNQSFKNNVKFEEIEIDNKMFLDNLKESYKSLEQPILNIGIPIYYISFKKIRSQKFRSVIAGDGGDELFFGYSYQKLLYYFNKFYFFYKHQDYFKNNIYGKKKLLLISYYLLTKNYDLLFNEINNLNLFSNKRFYDRLNVFQNNKVSDLKKYFEEDLNFKLSNDFVALKDNLGMSFNLETRFPFLQSSIVNYINKFSLKKFYNSKINKSFLYNIYKNEIDKEIFTSRKKGWTIPNTWLIEKETINFYQNSLPQNYKSFLDSIGIKFNRQNYDMNIKYRTLIFSLLTWSKKNKLL